MESIHQTPFELLVPSSGVPLLETHVVSYVPSVHLTPAALDAAIRLLEQPNGPAQARGSVHNCGDIVAIQPSADRKLNG